MANYSMSKAVAMIRATSIKTVPLKTGDVVTVSNEIVENTLTLKDGTEINADYVIATVNGANKRVPISEVVNNFMVDVNGVEQSMIAMSGEGAKNLVIPAKLTVKAANPRKSPTGEPMYALTNLIGSDAVLNGEMTYNEFIATQPKPKEGAEAMCSYIVTVQ